MAQELTIVVTGATGKQGGAVARGLLERGHKVRAVTRDPNSSQARSLANAGATLVAASLEDTAAIAKVLEGATSLFAMTTPFGGTEAEIRQGVAAADAAKVAGLHLVFTSVGNANRQTGVPHFDSKYEVEKHIAKISTRQGRFSEKPAQWILRLLQKRDAIDPRILDLRDFPMPFFDQAVPPAMPGRPPYEHEVVKKWTAQIAASDGFVFVTPEYNYGPSAVLKNAIDWVYPEWNRKAAAFVSYGSAMGVRVVQQLRQTATELQLAPIRSSVHIPAATLWAHFQGGDVEKGLAELERHANAMIDELLWWTATLKTARES